jgi:PIN domain nuclease of toxin-antitoxin system
MKYLLDTAPWINLLTMPGALPERILHLLNAEEIKGLCTISLLEAAILHRLGRLKIEGSLELLFEAGLSSDVQTLELSPEIAAATNDLPNDFPGDPFDRTIIATAKVLGLTIITADSTIRDAKICPVEYYPFKPKRAER